MNSFFDLFCFNYLYYLLYLFQLCLLTHAHRHQIPLHTASWELIGSSFLFVLTVGELHCWLNSSSSWMEMFLSTAGREPASLPLVYLKVRIVFVLTILTTYLPPWPAAQRGTYIGGERFRQRCFCRSLFQVGWIFYLWKNETFFMLSCLRRHIWSKQHCIVLLYTQHSSQISCLFFNKSI